MPAGKDKSHSTRKVFRVTPGNRNVVHRKKRRPQMAHCSETGQPLKGIPRAHPSELRNMAKSKKRPERPFGGVLSSSAMRKKIVKKARSDQVKQ